MTDLTPADAHKHHLRANFNALAATYDHLHFLQVCASRFMEHVPLQVGARVLDVATGTGAIAFLAASRIGSTGTVVGVDLAPEMLARARQKFADSGLTHIEFRQGDAEHLDFPDQSFDVVLCASSLFFVPDMLTALRDWRRVLVPGGTVGCSSFGPTFLQPLRELWEARLRQYGIMAAALPTHRLADSITCQRLLYEAGFAQIDVRSEQVGYYLPTAQARWADISAGLEGKPLFDLPEAEREQIHAEHLAEVAKLATDQGIWVDIPALFAFGQKATTPFSVPFQ